MNRTVSKSVVTKIAWKLDRNDLLELFRDHYPQMLRDAPDHDDVKIAMYFVCPTGYDCSGEKIDIDRDNPLYVTITRHGGGSGEEETR